MTKTFKPIKRRSPWLPILISHLFNKAILVLGYSFLHVHGVFWLRFYFYFKKYTTYVRKR